DAVVEGPYTTRHTGILAVGRSAQKWESKVEYGFCSPQRKRLLPGAQCAPRRKSAATAPGTVRGSRKNYGHHRSGSVKKTSLCRIELARVARTVEPADQPGRSPVAGSAKTHRQSSSTAS